MWRQVSRLNGHHMGLAWITLASLVVTDAYIALVAAGDDLRPPVRGMTTARPSPPAERP